MTLTAERLRELLDYDPETGVFTWKVNRGGGARAGDVAGYAERKGYQVIYITRKAYKAHRLAWCHVHGELPTKQVDHINGDKADNRIANLRLATHGQNRAHSRPSASSGLKGVYRFTDGRWQAQIRLDGRNKSLGLYDCPAAASFAYQVAAHGAHGEFAKALTV